MAISARPDPELPPLVGEAPAFRAALAQVSRLAALDRPVLVVGERGTGKELVAARLTYLSPRWDKPFVKLNCATLAESLLDSELFGHEAGAFTGATRRRLSRFEIADGGTLVPRRDRHRLAGGAGEDPARHRVWQLRARRRQRGAARRCPRSSPPPMSTCRRWPASGGFRSDLLDRLAFDVVTIPPLRERIRGHRAAGRAFRPRHEPRARPRGVSPASPRDALAQLRGASLARQCARAQERGRAQPPPLAASRRADRRHRLRPLRLAAPPGRAASSTLSRLPRDSGGPEPSAGPAAPAISSPASAAFEAALLAEALAAHHFNQRRTAAALGLTYHQLRHYLKKYALGGRS